MAKLKQRKMISNLKEKYHEYMDALSQLEESELDKESRNKAKSIIQECQVHSEIALDQIQS